MKKMNLIICLLTLAPYTFASQDADLEMDGLTNDIMALSDLTDEQLFDKRFDQEDMKEDLRRDRRRDDWRRDRRPSMWTCVAHNRRGIAFRGVSVARQVAAREAMRDCRRASFHPITCRVTRCLEQRGRYDGPGRGHDRGHGGGRR